MFHHAEHWWRRYFGLIRSLPCGSRNLFTSLQKKPHVAVLHSEMWTGILKGCLPLWIHHSSVCNSQDTVSTQMSIFRSMSTQNMIATHNGILFILRNKDSLGSCNNVAENNIVLNEISNPSKKRQMISVLTHVQKLKQSELSKAESRVVVTRDSGRVGGKLYLKGGCLTQGEGGTLKIYCTAWWMPLITIYSEHFKTAKHLVWVFAL